MQHLGCAHAASEHQCSRQLLFLMLKLSKQDSMLRGRQLLVLLLFRPHLLLVTTLPLTSMVDDLALDGACVEVQV